METVKILRSELYNLVWSTPATTILKIYLLTYTEFKEICARLEIPLPKAGHWAKLRAGKSVETFHLSADYKGDSEVEFTLRTDDSINLKKQTLAEISLTQENKNESPDNIVVPNKLTNPHKLIAEAKKAFSDKSSFHKGDLISSWESKVRIIVAKPSIGRALRIMDTFIKALEKKGHQLKLRNGSIGIIIFDQEFTLQLREKNKRVPNPSNFSWQEYDYIPTGILILAIKISWQNMEWKDDKQPLEKQLSKMIAKLEAKAIEEKEKHLRWEKERIIREEQYQIKKAEEDEMKKELEKFILLKKTAEAWHIAAQIRGYLKDLELKAIERKNMSEELQNWLNWAYKKLEWYDPNISAKDDLMVRANKETLTFT